MFSVGDYVYARIAMDFDYNSKSDIYHGIIKNIADEARSNGLSF